MLAAALRSPSYVSDDPSSRTTLKDPLDAVGERAPATLPGSQDSAAPAPGKGPTSPSATPAGSAPPPVRSNDTLLSAPAPAERGEWMLEEQLQDCQRRLDWLEARVAALEKKRATEAAPNPWWWWLAFLLLLALGWKLFGAALTGN